LTTPSKEYQDLYRAGVAAARAKDVDRARKLFLAAVTLDETQKSGWLALARLESDPQAKADYYRRVLYLDPQDAIARAYIDGMRHAQPWYRSRLAIGILGLLVLLLGGSLALVATRPASDADTVLPTSAQLPSPTATTALEAAMPLSADSPEVTATVVVDETESPTTPSAPVQATFLSLGFPTVEATPSPSPTIVQQQLVVATSTLPPAAPPTVFNPPPPNVPTSPSGGIIVTLVTAPPPTSTSAAAPTATPQPLFMDVTEPPPTSLPVFATPTLENQGDFNTEVPPTDQTFPEDPNGGGMRQP
jgi:hypothetical protein